MNQSSLVIVALPTPRRCWMLCEDVDTHEWEVADFEHREAFAVAMQAPHWEGTRWIVGSHHLLLTWTPNETGGSSGTPRG
jgi:hypothetical protein